MLNADGERIRAGRDQAVDFLRGLRAAADVGEISPGTAAAAAEDAPVGRVASHVHTGLAPAAAAEADELVIRPQVRIGDVEVVHADVDVPRQRVVIQPEVVHVAGVSGGGSAAGAEKLKPADKLLAWAESQVRGRAQQPVAAAPQAVATDAPKIKLGDQLVAWIESRKAGPGPASASGSASPVTARAVVADAPEPRSGASLRTRLLGNGSGAPRLVRGDASARANELMASLRSRGASAAPVRETVASAEVVGSAVDSTATRLRSALTEAAKAARVARR